MQPHVNKYVKFRIIDTVAAGEWGYIALDNLKYWDRYGSGESGCGVGALFLSVFRSFLSSASVRSCWMVAGRGETMVQTAPSDARPRPPACACVVWCVTLAGRLRNRLELGLWR